MGPPGGPPEDPSCTQEAGACMSGSCPLSMGCLGCLPGHCALESSTARVLLHRACMGKAADNHQAGCQLLARLTNKPVASALASPMRQACPASQEHAELPAGEPAAVLDLPTPQQHAQQPGGKGVAAAVSTPFIPSGAGWAHPLEVRLLRAE